MLKHVGRVAVLALVVCWTHSQSTDARSASGTNGGSHQQTQQQQQHNHHHQPQQQSPHAQQQYEGVPVAESGASEDARNEIGGPPNAANLWNDLSMVYRLYQQCAGENLSVCLKIKLLTGLEKTLRSSRVLKLIDGVQFIQSGSSSSPSSGKDSLRSKPAITERDLEASLPRALDAKEQTLNNLIFKKLSAFLQDHTLQVKFPDVRSWDGVATDLSEGRKKKDKKGGGNGMLMIPLLLGGTFVPIAYGALAMLAGKALIVSKLALVLASIIGIKKLLSGSGKDSSHEVVVSGGHSGWGRDFDLAYNGWKPHKDIKHL